ncbi:hypothetical protein V8043_004231, partial [Vibrio vulnificus]
EKLSKYLSNNYISAYEELKTTLRSAQEFSQRNSGEMAEHSIDFILSALYVRMCTTARTILLAAPKDTTTNSIWDYASFGTLLRNIIDALNSFMYLADKSITKEEKECRFLLFSLHDAVTRQKVFEFRGSAEQAELCRARASEVKISLSSNEYFKSLTENKQKHYLKGNDPFLLSKEEIIEANGGRRDDFLGLYKFLSANAHSYPMGYFKMAENEFGRGIHSFVEEEYTEMILQLTAGQLNVALWIYQNYKNKT